MCEKCKNISSALASLLVETHHMANIDVIDPEGDVILVCSKTEFQVSSVRIFGVHVPLLNQI